MITEHTSDNGGRGFKAVDLIHLINPIDFIKEPLDNIVSKLKDGGKFVKAVGKHLVKGLKAVAGGFDDIVIDGLKVIIDSALCAFWITYNTKIHLHHSDASRRCTPVGRASDSMMAPT